MTAPIRADAMEDIELDLFLEALHRRYHYDFRSYSRASLRRRVEVVRQRLDCDTTSDAQRRLLHEPQVLAEVIDAMTVQVSAFFRDPEYYRVLREQVVPHLRTFASVKVWVAGCANGEELYSLAILLREEGLLDRTVLYATEINRRALARAQAGVWDIEHMQEFSRNYQLAGGRGSLSDHYTAAYGRAVFDRSLKNRVVFSEHDLATDEVFSEVHLISCRNVLIYFDQTLQNRAFRLFSDSLVRGGFLGLGQHETLRFSERSECYASFNDEERIWRRTSLTGAYDAE
ncbi:CheR family methyltransferase [Paracoccus laeviglucosivorans]|uniref:Chemotaxis protein methyltransferase CheR n=1 Tax=Paracoccus laeviglucosivorans TaxID=1197861 RepID=A0A521EPQ7_9RHOB|nr:CheR family methyltransferase [Paracoccus laeviglucosivorans]SMO85913.1 chemotaxis protein methyltransferase CheR [Paracoccus laeviglucosivorans]